MHKNVLPQYQDMEVADIKNALQRFPFSVAAYNVRYDINIGSIIRACNAFGASQFIMIGSKKWDRRGALGTHHYTNIVFHETWTESLKWMRMQNLTPIGVDRTSNSIPIHEIKEKYDGHPVFIMGNERTGIPLEVLKECSKVIHIEQFGSIPSLNVAQAASIICNHYHECRRK